MSRASTKDKVTITRGKKQKFESNNKGESKKPFFAIIQFKYYHMVSDFLKFCLLKAVYCNNLQIIHDLKIKSF